MYSEELDRYIKERNNRELTEQELSFITNTIEHPQISNMKYTQYENKIEIWTNDGWYWKV